MSSRYLSNVLPYRCPLKSRRCDYRGLRLDAKSKALRRHRTRSSGRSRDPLARLETTIGPERFAKTCYVRGFPPPAGRRSFAARASKLARDKRHDCALHKPGHVTSAARRLLLAGRRFFGPRCFQLLARAKQRPPTVHRERKKRNWGKSNAACPPGRVTHGSLCTGLISFGPRVPFG